MRRLYVTAVAVALVALAAPAQAEDVHARNVEFLWSIVGEKDPALLATFGDGRTATLADAIEEAAARAGDVDLAALLAGAGGGSTSYVGSAWAVSYGFGPCPTVLGVPQPIFVPVDPQTWISSGELGVLDAHADWLAVVDWTLKQTFTYNDVDWSAVGSIGDFCFAFGGSYFFFPDATGLITVEA